MDIFSNIDGHLFIYLLLTCELPFANTAHFYVNLLFYMCFSVFSQLVTCLLVLLLVSFLNSCFIFIYS